MPLREVFDVSTPQHRSPVGSVSCRTRPASRLGRVSLNDGVKPIGWLAGWGCNASCHGAWPIGLSCTPTSAGCWEDDNRPVGYPGVKGIGQIYLLVLVSRDQAAKFPADRKAKDWDGYSQDQWRAINTIDVMSFNVSTT